MTQPTAVSLVVIHRRADRLGDLLQSVLPHVSEVVLVDTGPDDERPLGAREAFIELCRRVSEAVPLITAEYRCLGEWEFEGHCYIGDFGRARNFAHGLASNLWHLTLDADDVFQWPGEKLRLEEWLGKVLEEWPDVTGIAAPYDYQPEIQQRKVRLFRADSWRWEGYLHEELVQVGETMPVPLVNAEEFSVKHAGNYRASTRRNAAMLDMLTSRAVKLRPQEQLAWAAVLMMQGNPYLAQQYARAAARDAKDPAFVEHATILAACCHMRGGDSERAARTLGEVLAKNPTKWVAWQLLGQLWAESGAEDKARVCFQGAAHATDKSVGDLVSTEGLSAWSSRFFAGIDARTQARRKRVKVEGEAIHILCPSPIMGTWGPQAHLERALGGSEQAVIHLAPRLAERCPVVVWASPLEKSCEHGGVHWEDYHTFSLRDTSGPVVVWRAPRLITLIKNEDADRRVVFWAHDVPRRADRVHYLRADAILVLSAFHETLFLELGVPREKLRQIRNGIDVDMLRQPCYEAFSGERDPQACIYASAANRGLLMLLSAWSDVHQRVPEATLHVAYDIRHLTKLTATRREQELGRTVLEAVYELGDLGVTFHGGLTYPELLRLEARCGVWAYPTLFPEVSCITAMETQALGLQPVTTTSGALLETVLTGGQLARNVLMDRFMSLPLYFPEKTAEIEAFLRSGELYDDFGCSVDYIDRLVEALKSPMSDEDRAKLSSRALDSYDWVNVAAPFIAAVGEDRWPPAPRSDRSKP